MVSLWHGESIRTVKAKDHPLHRTYEGMMERCYYAKARRYPRYGGRGIVVCDRWLRSSDKKASGFWAFVEDMGPRPEGFTLDRKDNDGPYSPDNCRWASHEMQTSNKDQARGSRVGGSVLSEEQVRAIRERLKSRESRTRIAESFNVSYSCVQDIYMGKTWKHLT